MIEFDNQTTISELVAKNDAVMLFYYAKWCSPCKSITQTLLSLKNIFENKIEIISINVDEFPILTLENNAKSVPTLQYFKNGLLYLKESGFRTKDQLTKNMNALLIINNDGFLN